MLKVLRRPFTLNEPSRVSTVTLLPVPIGDTFTPEVSSTSDEYWRPFSGSSLLASWLMTWSRWLVSVSTSGAAAVACTVSVTWPTASCRSTRWRELTFTRTLFATAVEKPVCSAATLYRPTFTAGNS